MDIGASNWNEADASNSAAAPDGAPEGMAPSGVDDVLRAHQGAVKRWYNWTVPKVTGGTSTAYTLTYGVAPGALVDGMTHLVQFNQANGANPTLNINGLGPQPIQSYSGAAWAAVPPNQITSNMVCQVTYNQAAGAYRIISWPLPPPPMTVLANSVGLGGIPLNNTGVFFDGPQVAQGTAGTWLVMGTVTVGDTSIGSANFQARLTDGTTIIDSANASTSSAVGSTISISLSGVITNPAGNLRISVNDNSSVNGVMYGNSSFDGKSSTITAVRIG
jgi:hypothetical protein